MDKETERAILILLGVAIFSKLGEALSSVQQGLASAANTLQQGGASFYEMLHPDEKDHANDLPANPQPGKRMPPSAILALATLVGFPDPKLAAAIAMGESGGKIAAVNITPREHSVGLWQINTKVHPFTPEEMIDPLLNARAAFAISKGGTNWRPWGAYTNGSYKQHQQGVLA